MLMDASNCVINWGEYRKRQFVVALCKFFARFPKRKEHRITRRQPREWRWAYDDSIGEFDEEYETMRKLILEGRELRRDFEPRLKAIRADRGAK